jgi:hypothetical protein
MVSQLKHETGKRETYQEQAFALRIPVELDNGDLVRLKVEFLS